MPNYGYNNYPGYSQYPNYNNGYANPQYTAPVVYPLTYTNGLIGAKAFYMQQPNSTVYLLDSESNNTLYVKTSDTQGRCSLDAYRLTKISLDQASLPASDANVVYATKADVEEVKRLINDGLANVLLILKGASNESSTTTNADDVSGK